MHEYYQVWFSAENEEQARNILVTLTGQKLIVGGTILGGPSHFWWKGKEIDMDYAYIMGFTISENRGKIEEEYVKVSKEEIPMATFIKMEGNEKFLNYIFENTK
ncbi:MAG: divalent cation tolerance protein CutA [bacterium]|nr:divalent cation tolerance protein CutA [bacterium]